MRLPGTHWITIPMPPPEFRPEAWARTIDRLEAGPWTRLHLTHCGTVTDIKGHLEQLRTSMRAQVDWLAASSSMEASERRGAYRDMLRADSIRHDVPVSLFNCHVSRGLLDMNLAGVDRAFGRAL